MNAFEKFAKNVNGSIVFLIFTRIFAKIIVVCLKIFFLFRILDLDGEMVFGRWNHRRLGSEFSLKQLSDTEDAISVRVSDGRAE